MITITICQTGEHPDLKVGEGAGWCGDPSRGAAMGRPSADHMEGVIKIQPMEMVDGAYDKGGTYWGCGSHEMGFMYVLEDSEGNQAYLRIIPGKMVESVAEAYPDVTEILYLPEIELTDEELEELISAEDEWDA